jgi:hypothetical protein
MLGTYHKPIIYVIFIIVVGLASLELGLVKELLRAKL